MTQRQIDSNVNFFSILDSGFPNGFRIEQKKEYDIFMTILKAIQLTLRV